jgi:thiamine biosynthesis lipoprotein
MKPIHAALSIVSVVCMAGRVPDARGEATIARFTSQAMGTRVTLTAYTEDAPGARVAFDAATREFERLERLMSVWREGSDVLKLAAAAGGAPVKVSAETLEVLQRARQFSEWTKGKFDVTFGALGDLWRFDHDRDGRVPAAEEVRKRLPLIDYRALILDPVAKTARLAKAGMRVHLGGIGKGYAVDRAVAILRAAGLHNFLLQAGGDLYLAGRRGGRAWRAGIRDPRGPPRRFFAMVDVEDAAFSTSGDYERYFIRDGVRYHHIIDPHTGLPATPCRSVTAFARDATTADGLSTSVFLVGAEAGLALVEKIPGAGVVIVDANNHVHVSRRLKGRVRLLSQPSD